MSFSNQDPKVISVFEIVAAYFCDTIFNHIFHSAKTNVANGSSLTDEYVRRVHAYVIGVKNDRRCYAEIVKGVHTYFIGTTRFTTLGFADFVDRIVSVCVPPEYFVQFSPQDKDELLSSVLCDLVSNLTTFATKPDMLRRIIDGHLTTPDVTIRMLQDASVHTLITKRIALHNKFLRKVGQASDTVSMDVVEDMKKILRRLVKEKAEAVAEAELATTKVNKMLVEMQNLETSYKDREAKLLKLIELLKVRKDNQYDAGVGLIMPPVERIAEPRHRAPMKLNKSPQPIQETIAETRGNIGRGHQPAKETIAELQYDNAGSDNGSDNDDSNNGSDDGVSDGESDNRGGNALSPLPPSRNKSYPPVPNTFFNIMSNAEPIVETPKPVVRRSRPAFSNYQDDEPVEYTGNPELDNV
jgi:hypothetical protein